MPTNVGRVFDGLILFFLKQLKLESMRKRETLIAFIEEYAMDEIETVQDALKIAKMSIKELEDNVESIIAYYKDTHNTIINL